jgi:hypothetical protein
VKKIRIPSLQHLCRNWSPDPKIIQKNLIELVDSPPNFSYTPLRKAAFDILLYRQPIDEIMKGLQRKEKRENVLKNFREVLILMESHFAAVRPIYVQTPDRRSYSVDRDISIAFEPALVFSHEKTLVFPWFSYWRNNPLQGRSLSLFVTIVDDILFQDPDLDIAQFQILDFSAPKTPKGRSSSRVLKVLLANDIPRVNNSEKQEMLQVFIAGYRAAQQELSSRGTESGKKVKIREMLDASLQGDLFK